MMDESSLQPEDDLEIILMERKKLIENCLKEDMKNVDIESIAQWLEHPNKDRFINWKNDDIANGRTMLICALRFDRVDIAGLLLKHGADIHMANKFGTTALMEASYNGHVDIVKLLMDEGADITMADEDGVTPLMFASTNGHPDIVKLLVDKGVDIDIANVDGTTALMAASTEGHMDIVKLLMDKGADTGIANINGTTPLISALEEKHTDIVKLLVDKAADLNIVDCLGKTALMEASSNGQDDIVKLLVDKGADLNISNGDGWTALMFALEEWHIDVVKLLVDKGADLNIANEDGWTALIFASANGHNDVVKLLVDKGADIDVADKYGKTALIIASYKGHGDIVELLLDKGADMDVADKDGKTALILAWEEGHTNVLKCLVDKGADDSEIILVEWKKLIENYNSSGKIETVAIETITQWLEHPKKERFINWKDGSIANGGTMLICAIWGGRFDIAEILLEHGADITISDEDGDTPLMNACEQGHKDVVKLLLEKGADIKIVNKDGMTALMWASYHAHHDIVKLLVDKGADDSEIILLEWKKLIERSDSGEIEKVTVETIMKWLEHPSKDRFINWKNDSVANGRTMLICALRFERLDIAKLLLEHGADIHVANKFGTTSLMEASWNGDMGIVKLLLDEGADVTITDEDGKTALIFACSNGNKDIVKLLTDKGADITIADKDGNTALIFASCNGDIDTVKFILDKGTDMDVADDGGKTSLMIALERGHCDIVKLLVDRGADITIVDNDGSTALMYATRGGHMDIVKLLMDKGADSNIANKKGETALMKASQGGHTEIVELLMERSLSVDIGSLLDAGVTIERLEELYTKEKVHNVVQAHFLEQPEEGANRADRPTAAAVADLTVEGGDEENVKVPPTPDAFNTERSRSLDIGTLEKLEEIYPKEEVHKVVQARIVKQAEEEDEMQRRRRGNMARLLFLRSKSTALKEVLRNSVVMDQVLVSLLANPEEEILMCPLMLAPLKDPVVISSGFVLDRSTALYENGNLRIQVCPFSRSVLSLPVYPCIPIRSKLKAWEAERMNRCIEVAEKMVESKEWERATKVFDIAETLLQEMGDKTYFNLARKLANLELKIPFVENDVERTLKIHQRLIRAAKGDKGETLKLLREAIKECCKKLGGLMVSDDLLVFEECTKTRWAYSKEVLSPSALIDYQAELKDELLVLYELDLALAKKLKSTAAIWSSRRMILGLWETQSCDDDETSNANKTIISEFFKQEGLTGNEKELSLLDN